MEAGRLKNHEPSPISVTIRAATATEAPSSRADSATTGRMAPWPMLNRSAGPNAGTAMLRRLKGGGLFGGVIPFILGRRPRGTAETRAPRGQNHNDLIYIAPSDTESSLAKVLSVLSIDQGEARGPQLDIEHGSKQLNSRRSDHGSLAGQRVSAGCDF